MKMTRNIPEDFERNCKNCGHRKFDHLNNVVSDDDLKLGRKPATTKSGICNKNGCDCKKFIPPEGKCPKCGGQNTFDTGARIGEVSKIEPGTSIPEPDQPFYECRTRGEIFVVKD